MDGLRKPKTQLEMKRARIRKNKKVFSKYISSKRKDKENKVPLLNGAVGTMQSKLLYMLQFSEVCAQLPFSSLSLVADSLRM